ncbi:MAG: hypothetical protein Ctma_0558 [Catillopecten margaritatus gill symbiont]|uniref:Ion transport domain-containing protein n=1 Tax=Catillopecten margaritatus gill symbiont TaxID=3083288 RepID=A0AAU6PFU6_9GAMM
MKTTTHFDLKLSIKQGWWFLLVTKFFTLLAVVAFSLSTLPNLSKEQYELINLCQSTLLIIFIMEYMIRLYLSKNKKKTVFGFYGVVDFLSIAPSLLLSADTQVLRVLRLLSIFNHLKYSKAINRLTSAITENKDELVLFFTASVVMLFLSAAGVYVLENPAQPEVFRSIFDSLWWAVATLTTVGYGDIYPITVGGKLLTYVILMIGLSTVAIPTGLIASTLSQRK